MALPNPTDLLDVLGMLPPDTIEESIWTALDSVERGHFKLTSRASRQLSDKLISAATHDMRVLLPQNDDDRGAGRRTRWQQSLDHQTAFLTRLPHLKSLLLKNWPSEAHLVRELLACGAASAGRVTHLALQGGAPALSGATLQAAATACSRLCQLSIRLLSVNPELLHDALFLPLHGSMVTKLVVVGGSVCAPPAALASLSGLSHLRHLQLQLSTGAEPWALPAVQCHDLSALTGLVHLRHCDVQLYEGQYIARHTLRSLSLPQVAPLLSAPHLTTLRLPNVDHAYPRPAPGISRDERVVAVMAALELMGGLVDLRSLTFSETCTVDEVVLPHLVCLTQLTCLHFCGITAALPLPGGHLPHLQHLCLGSDTSAVLLLGTLAPLAPLPSLTQLNKGSLLLSIIHSGGADAGRQAAALPAAAQLLAAAPRLALPGAKVRVRGGNNAHHLSLYQTAVGLQPLAGRIQRLCLRYMMLRQAPWHELHLALPGLTELKLRQCSIAPFDLLSLLQCMRGLRRLHLSYVACDLGDEGWTLVAAGRCEPLQLRVEPALGAGVVAACRAVQERMYGRQFIQWLSEFDD